MIPVPFAGWQRADLLAQLERLNRDLAERHHAELLISDDTAANVSDDDLRYFVADTTRRLRQLSEGS